ncbi:MAG: hypothetical protein ACOYBE_03900 [Blautia sp.]
MECAGILPLFFLAMVTLIGFMQIYQLQTEQLLSLCEKTKQAGIYAYAVKDGPAEITLPAVRTYESPVGVLPLPKVWLKNQVTVHAWVGYQGEDDSQGEEAEEMVYVTASGEVYHTDISCRHLKVGIKQVTVGQAEKLRNRYGEKYYRCERCGKADGTAGNVYITDTGNRFHCSQECSGLKRTIRLVKRSQVSQYAQCKSCSGHS